MPNIATLGLKIDTSSISKATSELKKLPPAASGAERAAQGVARSMTVVSAASDRVALDVARARAGLVGHVGVLSRFRPAMQQIGFQVADVATQISMGTNAMRALSIQGGQLLGFFGPFGAIAGGALVVAGAFASSLFETSDSAQEAGDSLETLSAIMEDLRGKMPATQSALEASVRNVVGSLKRDLDEAQDRLNELEQRFSGVTRIRRFLMEDTPPAALQDAREEVRRLRLQFQIARAEAGEFPDGGRGVNQRHAEQALEHARRVDERRRRQAEREAARDADRIARVTEALQHQQDQLGRTAREQEQFTALQRAGIDSSHAQAASIMTLAGGLYDAEIAMRRAEETAWTVTAAMDRAFAEFTESGKFNVRDMVNSMLQDLARLAFRESVTTPLSEWLSSSLAAAFGGPMTQFATGGVITGPTLFPMRNGAGLMGEAGPEAIMPLRRGPDGRLGVEASGSSITAPIHVSIDARGAQAGAGNEIMAQIEARLPSLVISTVKDAQSRRVL